MFGKISNDEKEVAVHYLMNHIPKDCLKKVSIAVKNKGSSWSLTVNMCFGMYVLNVLREGGFKCFHRTSFHTKIGRNTRQHVSGYYT